MSIPAETPAAVITFPCTTTRAFTGMAPKPASNAIASQCVVASRPFRIPAAPSTSAPVQTEVVRRVVG